MTRVDEYYELSGLPELDFLPALVPQELSRLLEAVRPEQELQRPRGFGWQVLNPVLALPSPASGL